MKSDLLVIMAKYPTPGKVKTRLAAEIGARRAAALYRGWLESIAREFARPPFAVEWRYTPARAPFKRLLKTVKIQQCLPQPTGNLGERMQQIFAASFAKGYRRVVMIGTDAPAMNQRTVRRAFHLLRDRPAVFQPTDDGGYALVGLRTMIEIFTGIAWSTAQVMAQTRTRLREFQIKFAELPATFDVDTAADLARLSRRHQPGYGTTRTR